MEIKSCRICDSNGTTRSQLRSIFALEEDQTLASLMEELSGIKISTNSRKSEKICQNCLMKIKIGCGIRKQIIDAERSAQVDESLEPSTYEQFITDEHDGILIGSEVKLEDILEEDTYEYEFLEECTTPVDAPDADDGSEESNAEELTPTRPLFAMPKQEVVVGVSYGQGFMRVQVRGDRCCGCSFVGEDRRDLLRHSELEHCVDIVGCGNYCPICFFKFASGEALTRHIDECQSRDILVCRRCNNYFNSVRRIEEHLRVCKEIGLSFAEQSSNDEENQVELVIIKNEPSAESGDSEWEPTQEDLLEIEDYSEEEDKRTDNRIAHFDGKKDLNCDGIPLKTIDESRVLRRVSFTTFEYVKLQHERCCGCSFACKNREELFQHSYDVHEKNVDDFACPICCESFSTSEKMTRHINFYTSKQLLICNVCEEAFPGMIRLKLHQDFSEKHAKKFPNVADELRVELADPDVQARLNLELASDIPRNNNRSITRHRHLSMPDTRFIAQIEDHSLYEVITVNGERCCGCGDFFETFEDVLLHGRQQHLLESPDAMGEFQCEICYSRFEWHRSLILHKSTRRAVNKLYHCTVCKLMFSKKYSIEKHLASAPNHPPVIDDGNVLERTEPEQYYCCFPKCGQTFLTEPSMLDHCESVHGGKRRENESERTSDSNVCPGCCKSFENTTCLVWHRTTRFTKRYTCRFCDQVFNRWAVYREHENVVHLGKANEFPCETCQKVFRTAQRLKAHQTVHAERREICSECGAGFRNKGVLKRHRRTVHAHEFPFDCPHCAKKFPTQDQMTAHLRVHTGVKPFSCRFCERTFSHFTDRKRHEMSTHTGERPYRCQLCPAAYIRNRELNIHMQKHTADNCEK